MQLRRTIEVVGMMRKTNNDILHFALFLSFYCFNLKYCSGFQLTKFHSFDRSRNAYVSKSRGRGCIFSRQPKLNVKNGDSDSDEDGYIDESSLGDWRSFRKNLLDVGLSSGTGDSTEGYIGDVDVKSFDDNKNNVRRPKSVSKLNEELLLKQNEELAREYLDGAWAHETPTAEIGGLTVRLPLEAEIYRNGDKFIIGRELISRLGEEGKGNDSLPLGLQSEEDQKKNASLSVSLVEAKTLLWYKKAQGLIEERAKEVGAAANAKGEIDTRDLNPSSAVFLKLYLDSLETWQEVCLVVNKDSSAGTAETLVLNRPMAFKLTKNIARLVLYGAYKAMLMDTIGSVSGTEELVKFLSAFEHSCAVYIGGKDKMDAPAMMIHGISDLEGAREISPGTGIYEGGLSAAIDGVLDGKYNALDFRFFVGRHQYKDSQLDGAVLSHRYQPIASARALALKQCIQLPKPLWHEILELCGGELREISKLELMKRSDIQVEDTEE